MQGVDDGRPQETAGSKGVSSKNAEGQFAALVAARHRKERRARSRSRGVQAHQCKENCHVAEALGGTQRAPKIRGLSLRAIDADLLYQPRRQEPAEHRTRPAGARENRVEAAVSSRMI